MRTSILVLLLVGLVGVASAKPWWMRGVESNESDFLPPDAAFRVSAWAGGKGVLKSDPYLGTQEIYQRQVEATVPYTRFDAGAHPLQIKVTYQGCAEAGLCYPPISKVLLPAHAAPAAVPASHPWVGAAILAGGLAFLLAGLTLRKGRKLDLPAA